MCCLCGMLLFSSNGLTDGPEMECCSEMTCNYVRALGGSPTTIAILREFRDKVLSQTPESRQLIDIYYTWGPALVGAMEQDDKFKRDVREWIELYLPMMKEERN